MHYVLSFIIEEAILNWSNALYIIFQPAFCNTICATNWMHNKIFLCYYAMRMKCMCIFISGERKTENCFATLLMLVFIIHVYVIYYTYIGICTVNQRKFNNNHFSTDFHFVGTLIVKILEKIKGDFSY